MRLLAFLAGALASAPLFVVQEPGGAAPGSPGGRVPSDPASSFVGSQSCRECHASTHSSWTNGRHSKMLQPAGLTSVIPAFGGSLNLRGKEYRLDRDNPGRPLVGRPG